MRLKSLLLFSVLSAYAMEKPYDGSLSKMPIEEPIAGFLQLGSFPKACSCTYKLEYFDAHRASLGFCDFSYNKQTGIGTIDLLEVPHEYRNQGCGSVLLKTALSQLCQNQITKILVVALPEPGHSIHTLIRFYSRFGFTVAELVGNIAAMEYIPKGN